MNSERDYLTNMTLAIDFDHTLADTAHPVEGRRMGPPMPGAAEAMRLLKAANHNLIIHSCNRTKVIRDWMAYYNIPFDSIWGESPADNGHKPVASIYLDDRGIRFTSWAQALTDIEGYFD